jgi:hypothetical protein
VSERLTSWPPTGAAIADRRKIYLPLELESDFWALLRKTRPGMDDVPGRTGSFCLGAAPNPRHFERTRAEAGAATAATNAAMMSSLIIRIIRVTPPFNGRARK